jgi:hypothetical protein
MARQAFRNAGWCTLLLAATRAMGGQDVLGGARPVLITTAGQDDLTNSQMSVFIPFGSAGKSSLSEPFQYDHIVVRPHIDYQVQYGDGIQSGPGNPQNSVIQVLEPGVRVDFGRYWSADFSPTLRYYTNSKFKSEFDYTASLSGGTSYGNWNFGVSQIATVSSTPLAETAAQTDQSDYNTALTANYFFNDVMSLDLAVSQDLNYITNPYGISTNSTSVEGTRTWSTMDWLNYTIAPRLNAGIGAGGGYVNADAVADQTFENFQGRVRWRATDKISLNLSAGFTDTQYSLKGESGSLNPIFNASIQYGPFKETQITLSAAQDVASSSYYIRANSTVNTTVTMELNQQLLRKFNLDLAFNYAATDYSESLNTTVGISSNRTDDTYGFNAKLSHPFLKRGTWDLTYQYTDNQSNAGGFGYNSTLFGFEINYNY